MSDMIVKRARRRKEGYSVMYHALLKHVNNFSDIYNCDIFTNSVNIDFLDDFIIYLQDIGLRNNTIKNYIEKAQYIVKLAGEYNYAIDPTYKEIKLKEEETYAVYLSQNEISRLYYYKFPKQDCRKSKERLRDMFILGCYTGFRYSDYSDLSEENINNGYLMKRIKKNGVVVRIPMHDYVKEIFHKYKGKVPRGYSHQTFNSCIKKICKEVGFNDKHTFSYTKGGKVVTKTLEKWQLICSHTARRSAITNMYLSGRFKLYEIMQFSGHQTESNVLRYIRVGLQEISTKMAGDIFFKK